MADKTSPAQKRKRGKQPKERQKSSDSSGTDSEARTKRVKTVFEDNKDEIKVKFQMEMPQDFYDLWEFCKTLNTKRPAIALKGTLNLELVGPFDVLAGKSKEVNDESVTSYHLHWRYYYDPPEFQTVIKSCEDNQGFHIGYFRDDPNNLPVFLASNDANIGCEMTVMGDNLFAAVSIFLAETLKKCKDNSKKESLKNIQTKLSDKASELQYSLASMTPKIKSRNKSSNSKTFHRAGMVVPCDATEVGYRPLTITDGELKKILKKICESKSDSETASEKLQEIITYVQFANDECDYGMGLELGLDVFCFGEKRFENLILQLMPLAYRLLGRDLFAEIIELHVKNRHRKNLNIFVKT